MKTNTTKNKNTTKKKVTKTKSQNTRKSKSVVSRNSKGKIYIPKSRIILLCLGIITVCMLLLLITTMIENNSNKKFTQLLETESILYPENKTSEKKNESEKVTQKETLPEETKNTPEKKNETPKVENKTEKEVISISEDKNISSKTEVKQNVENTTKTNQQEETKTPVKTEVQTETKTVSKTEPKIETKTEPVKSVTSTVSKVTDNTTSSQTQNKTTITGFNFPQAVNHAQLVFLFDDGGQSLSQVEQFLNLPFPITVAVLPKLAHSREVAEKVRKSGNEVMLHQPMQAINPSVNPGPGAILPNMSEGEIVSTLYNNLNEVGPVVGINNHEGSAITADAEKMETVLKTASRQGVFFLDSRTNKDTQVPYVCRELGYNYYERNGNFLDNTKTRENALAELRKNIDIANKTGVVIMIGHIWSADFLPQLLRDVYPELKAKGYTITTVSKCKGRK